MVKGKTLVGALPKLAVGIANGWLTFWPDSTVRCQIDVFTVCKKVL